VLFDPGIPDGSKSGSVIWDEKNIPDHISEKSIFFCILKVTEDFGTDPESGFVSQRYGSEDPDPYPGTKMSWIRKSVSGLVPEQNVSVVDSCMYKYGQIFGFLAHSAGTNCRRSRR
jgi:hypothetical protein